MLNIIASLFLRRFVYFTIYMQVFSHSVRGMISPSKTAVAYLWRENIPIILLSFSLSFRANSVNGSLEILLEIFT